MCGIVGFNFEDKDLLKIMCNTIKHRGPDDVGYFTNNQVSIGMRRLSIIDLSTGHQPQHNENEDIWIVLNGEIFNFRDLREELIKKGHKFSSKSDTESVLHAYEEWGFDCLNRLRGQFAFCIYDSRKEILFLARDHIGLIPLYYVFDGNKFIFGSEIKSILSHKIHREVDKNAFSLYLSFKYVPFNLTLFKGVYKLAAASYIIFDLKKRNLYIKKYWNFEFSLKNNKPIAQLASELKGLIEESVKIRLYSDVPIGAFLSGGIDSTSIVGVMSKYMDEPVKTFSIEFEEGAPVNEMKYANLVAEYYKTNHKQIVVKSSVYTLLPKIIWHLDDLISDAAVIPVYIMAKNAKEGMKVAVTGDGADEVFSGYAHYYKTIKNKNRIFVPNNFIKFLIKYYNYIPSQNVRMALSYLNRSQSEFDRFFRTICLPDEEKTKILHYKTQAVKDILNSKIDKSLDIINQILYWDLKYQLPSQYNMKTDKMTMAAALETRVPFLDIKIIEWASSIPSNLKLKGNIEKYILRLAMKEYLPREIIKRKKMGFTTPVNLWLKTGLKDFSGEILDRLSKRQDLIKHKYIKTIKRNRFKAIYENRAWNLIMFELWYETFIENDGLQPISLF